MVLPNDVLGKYLNSRARQLQPSGSSSQKKPMYVQTYIQQYNLIQTYELKCPEWPLYRNNLILDDLPATDAVDKRPKPYYVP